jgi:hypothetical protein
MSECEGGGVHGASGGPIGALARQVAWPTGPPACWAARGHRDGGRTAQPDHRQRACGREAVGLGTMTDVWSTL